MKYNYNIRWFIISAVIMMTGCEEKWDHYDSIPETVDKNVWEEIRQKGELSMFADLIEELNYDTLFLTNDPYTLFIPDNEAVTKFLETSTITASVLDYHISRHFIQSSSIRGTIKVQTLAEKFALFENSGKGLLFDDIPIESESPLYYNGKYFIIKEMGYPRPNIYEYFAANNPIFKSWIDEKDSIIVDMEKSRPLGFDDEGNTIYDTVAIIYNEFEQFFFPVREEFRNRTATLVFPNETEYNEALSNMATYMGSYQDYTEVPLRWQNEILIPHLMEQGVFENMIEKNVFSTPTKRDTVKMKNILGDSIVINYSVDQKILCSNGYVYTYSNFKIPDTLYMGSVNFEAESLLRETGINRFAWREGVNVESTMAFSPERDYNVYASNDSLFRVPFPKNYSGTYSIEFKVDHLFPRKYLMVVGTNINIGGIYDIYVNDELVRTMDWGQYQFSSGMLWSVTGKKRYIPKATYNKFDAFVDNKAEYGETRVRFVYREPGNVLHNGLTIDNLEFVPYDF
jgi:hypothetical protein